MNLLNKLLKVAFTCLFLFTPLLMFSKTSELFEFNKLIFIYLIAILVVLLWSVKMIKNGRFEIRKSFFDIPIIIFYLSQVLSTAGSIDIHTSLFGYYGRFNGGLLSLTAYIFLYYAFISNFDKTFALKLLKISLISSVIVILWGLPGKFGLDLSCLLFTGQFNNSCWTDQFHPELRMFSTLGQPNWLGAFLVVNFFIGLYFYIKNLENHSTKYEIPARNATPISNASHSVAGGLCTLYLFLNFAALLFTRSRSSYFALGAGILLFVLMGYFNFKRIFSAFGPKRLYLFLGATILFLFLFKTGIPKIDKVLNLPFTFQKPTALSKVVVPLQKLNITESFDIRKVVWKGAVDLGLRYPLFGSGVETFAYAYYFTRPVEHNLTSEWDYLYNKAHNEYLNYFATTGFAGLGAYLIMIGTVCFVMLRSVRGDEKNERTYLFLAYLTILITNFFGFSVTTINLYFYLIPAFIVVFSTKENKTLSFNLKANSKVLTAFSILVSFYLFLSTFLYWMADIKYAEANRYSQVSDYKTSAQLLLTALQMRNEHVYKDKLSYALANLAFAAAYGKDESQSKKLMKLSKDYNDETIKSSSKNVLYYKTKAKNEYLFYSASLDPNYIKIGVEALNEAARLSPTDPKNYYSLAVFYSILFDETKNISLKTEYNTLSLQALSKMIKLKPDYAEGLILEKQLLEKYQK